jgi:hypothetical protein
VYSRTVISEHKMSFRALISEHTGYFRTEKAFEVLAPINT